MPDVAANGIRLHYETFGDPSGRPLVLIMGLAAQMILWHEEFCEALARRGQFVIRFDNRDVGRSTWIRDTRLKSKRGRLQQLKLPAVLVGLPVPIPYTLEDMADDTAGLIEALGLDSAHVCGASMGGMIAQTLALRQPERVRSLVSMLAHTGSKLLPPPKLKAIAALLSQTSNEREAYIQRAVRLWRTIGSPGFPFDEEATRARSAAAFERGVNAAGSLRQLLAIAAQKNRTKALRSLEVPTLVIHGADDPLVPVRGARATARAIPGAEIRVFDGMGHDIPRPLWPQLTDAISDFTQQVEARRGPGPQ